MDDTAKQKLANIITHFFDHPEGRKVILAAMEEKGVSCLNIIEKSPLPSPAADDGNTRVGIILDVETEGLGDDDKIIEISLLKIHYTSEGIVSLGETLSYLNDPGRPLNPEVVALTGITDEMVRGHRVDLAAIDTFTDEADIFIAFNTGFDRQKIEHFWPDLRMNDCEWFCALKNVEWKDRGVIGTKKLSDICFSQGYVFGAHRATSDILATAFCLNFRDDNGRTAFSEMLENGRRKSYDLLGADVHYDDRMKVKENGYLWDGEAKITGRKVWYKSVSGSIEDLRAEVEFLKASSRGANPIQAIETTSWNRFSAQKRGAVVNVEDEIGMSRNPSFDFNP